MGSVLLYKSPRELVYVSITGWGDGATSKTGSTDASVLALPPPEQSGTHFGHLVTL